MEDEQELKKPVIDWQQVYIRMGLDMALYNKINNRIISVETLEIECELNGS